MKTQILSLLFLAIASIASASGIVSLSTTNHEVAVDLTNASKYGATLSIEDLAGVSLFNETVLPMTSKKTFDLSKLPTGAYELKVENHLQISTFTVNVTTKGVNTTSEVVTYKPNVTSKDGIVKVNMLTLGEKASVKILDAENNVIFVESSSNEPSLHKAYSIENLSQGVYTLAVTNNENTFYFTIKK